MYRFQASKSFQQGFQQLEESEQQAIEKALHQLVSHSRPASLHVKIVQGAQNGLWEARATMNVRFTFHRQDPHILILRTCGHHHATPKHS